MENEFASIQKHLDHDKRDKFLIIKENKRLKGKHLVLERKKEKLSESLKKEQKEKDELYETIADLQIKNRILTEENKTRLLNTNQPEINELDKVEQKIKKLEQYYIDIEEKYGNMEDLIEDCMNLHLQNQRLIDEYSRKEKDFNRLKNNMSDHISICKGIKLVSNENKLKEYKINKEEIFRKKRKAEASAEIGTSEKKQKMGNSSEVIRGPTASFSKNIKNTMIYLHTSESRGLTVEISPGIFADKELLLEAQNKAVEKRSLTVLASSLLFAIFKKEFLRKSSLVKLDVSGARYTLPENVIQAIQKYCLSYKNAENTDFPPVTEQELRNAISYKLSYLRRK